MNALRLSVLGSSLLVLLVACGDDTSGGGGSGNGTNNGGEDGQGANNNGGSGAGSEGGNGTEGGGGQGEGGGPIGECTDPAINVPEGDCDLYLQDCPVATDTCEIGDADPNTTAFEPITICITNNGLKSIGESCNTVEDCQAHLTCVGNKCSTFCCPEDPGSCAGGDCSITVQLVDENEEPTGFTFLACSFAASCDLFTPDSCGPTENCYLGQNPGETACASVGDELADGTPCMFVNDCQDSAVCVGPQNGEAVCRFLCEANSNDPPGLGGCPAGQLCDTNSLDTGFADVGFCHP